MTTLCAVCQTSPATETLGDERICTACLHLIEEESDRRLRAMVAALEREIGAAA